MLTLLPPLFPVRVANFVESPATLTRLVEMNTELSQLEASLPLVSHCHGHGADHLSDQCSLWPLLSCMDSDGQQAEAFFQVLPFKACYTTACSLSCNLLC